MRRAVLESFLRGLALFQPAQGPVPNRPGRIFVLRNNDLGDVLTTTPLFRLLKQGLRDVEVIAGVGNWARPILEGNPFVDGIVPINGPWHNKFVVGKIRSNSLRGFWRTLRYLYESPEVHDLRQRRFDTGIDVLGSTEGAMLLLRARIPRRLGVRGYAGGHSVMTTSIPFTPEIYVGRFALQFAEALGLNFDPARECRPEIFLSLVEREHAETRWKRFGSGPRILVGFSGGGIDKVWPADKYRELLELIAARTPATVILVGGPGDSEIGVKLAHRLCNVVSLAGEVSLRETFALTLAADVVVSNSSVLMHAAAAGEKRNLILLGESFSSVRQHEKLWTCNPAAVTLGREKTEGRTEIASVNTAFTSLMKLLPR